MKKVKESNAAIKIILLTVFVILFIAVCFIDSVFLAGDAISYGKFSFIGKLIPSVGVFHHLKHCLVFGLLPILSSLC